MVSSNLSGPFSNIDKVSGHGRGGGHGWADKMRATALALPALEVAIGSTGAAFAGLQDVRIHAQAHAAACFAPLEASIGKHAVETLLLGSHLHLVRTGHNHCPHPRVDVLALHD